MRTRAALVVVLATLIVALSGWMKVPPNATASSWSLGWPMRGFNSGQINYNPYETAQRLYRGKPGVEVAHRRRIRRLLEQVDRDGEWRGHLLWWISPVPHVRDARLDGATGAELWAHGPTGSVAAPYGNLSSPGALH